MKIIAIVQFDGRTPLGCIPKEPEGKDTLCSREKERWENFRALIKINWRIVREEAGHVARKKQKRPSVC